MYRQTLEKIIKEKNISIKKLAADSGVSIDTISRIIHPDKAEKDSPRVSTLQDLCSALGIEVWKLFYNGDKNLISLQTEKNALKAERDILLADNAILKEKNSVLEDKVDALKDDLIDALKFNIRGIQNNEKKP